MNSHQKYLQIARRAKLVASFLLLLPGSGVLAQKAPEETIIELSPFVVSEDSETGWVATETLAGSRLRTDFKDVANQIETLTKEFMSDLAVNSLDQAAIYTANSENANDYVTYVAEERFGNPTMGARVRGIGSGTNSRNFFQVYLSSDNYNVERATIASGPNAILFGLGSPAGILDTTTARAQMRNRYGFTVQIDSENSRRATFDANQQVIKNTLAVRVMGMSQRAYTFKKPNLDRDDRLYVAVTYKPFKHTVISLQGERVSRLWNTAIRTPPRDYVSLWYNADKIPGSGYTMPRPVYDNSSFAGIGGNIIFSQAGDAPVLVNGSSEMRNYRNSVNVRNPVLLPGTNLTFDGDTEHTVNDPEIFPFDNNAFGTMRASPIGGNNKTAIIEQRLAPNLYLELAYNFEDAYSERLGVSSGNLFVDANRYLAGTTTPNPNLGRLYVQGLNDTDFKFNERSAWRATLSYELDLARVFGHDRPWARWLGRHRLAGLYTGEDRELREGQNFYRRILDDPVLQGVTLRPKTFRNWANHSTRMPQFRDYLDGPHDYGTPAGPMKGTWMMNDANGKPFELYSTDTPLVSATSGKRLGGGQAPSGSLYKSNAWIFAWQGFFLPDRQQQSRLVVTYGYRKDTARVATFDDASTAQDFSGLYPVVWDAEFGAYGEEQSGVNRNVGIIVRPIPWFSMYYNQSSSFDLNVGRYDPFGNEYPGAGGDGKDIGVRLDLWKNKLTLRINRYETSLGPQRASNQINGARDDFWGIEARVRELNPGVPTINVTDGNMRGFRNAGRPNYWIMSDFSSEGYELELNYTPTPNWNIRLNGSKSEAVETNIGEDWFEYVRQREPVWKSVVATNGEVDAKGNPVTWTTAVRNPNDPTGESLAQNYARTVIQSLAFISAVDGRATDTARPSRLNFITNYRFRNGPLKGFNLGGAARWRSAPSIGYGLTDGPAGEPIMDLDQQYRGKEEFYVDAFIGYRGRTDLFGGFNYRVQLNIRNLLNEDDVIPITATTTGQIVRIATVEPRLFVGTFGVEF